MILAGLKKTRLGIPRDGRITERAVTLTQEFLRNIGALKTTIPYEHLMQDPKTGQVFRCERNANAFLADYNSNEECARALERAGWKRL